MNGRSPQVRLVILYCTLLLILGATFAVFTLKGFEHFTAQTIVRETTARSAEIWHTVRGNLDNRAQLASVIESRFAPEAQSRFIQVSEDLHIIYRSDLPPGTDTGKLHHLLSTAGPALRSVQAGSLFLDRQTYRTAAGRRITIDSGQSDRFAQSVEDNLTRSLLMGLPVLLLLAAIGGYVLMRQSIRPIERMIDAAEAITFNNPETRLPLARTGDRLETLGLALNRMLDRLDSAYQFANRFSIDAAHELRTPLAIVKGELELMAAGNREPAMGDALQTVTDEINRLSEMVDNLGLINRLDSLWGKHTHAEFDLNALAQETLENMQGLAQAKGIAISPLAGSPAFVAGDRNRLKQVLVNLLDNAIKYTPPGGSISLTVRSVGNRAELVVADTGIGIPSEHRQKVFERFYRVSTDRGETGSGLGLSIVQSICNAHGGRVAVESTPGTGSTFRVELPLSNVVPST